MPSCLLIDDNEVNLAVAKRLLEQLGFAVTALAKAEAAVPYIEKSSSDVVLLDWHMPGMNGLEFLKLMRTTEKGRNTAIFIYSGIEDENGIQSALDAGADGFIPKPITKEKVIGEFQKVRLL